MGRPSLKLCFSLAWIATLAVPTVARASGFDAPQVGSQQSGPVIRDAAAIHYNPGQLGYFDHPEISFGGGVIVGSIGYQRERRGQYQYADNFDFAQPIDPMDLDPSKQGRAERVSAVPVGPTVDVFAVLPVIRDRFSVGLGVYVPYAAVLDLDADGPQRWQAQNLFLASAHTTLSAGVKLHDVISIGGGLTYALSFLELSKVQDFAAVDSFGDTLAREPIGQANDFGGDAPSTVRELDVLARQVDVTNGVSHSLSFNAGIALRPTDALSLALVYQHGSRLKFDADFVLNMDDDFFTQDLASQGLQYPSVVRGDAEVRMRLPKRVTVGAGYQIAERFGIDGFVQYAFYQDFDVIDIRFKSPDLAQPELGVIDVIDQELVRNWKGSVLTEWNARIEATDKLRVSALVGYHSPASPDSTIDMASPDGHRIIFGAGLGYRFNDIFTLYGDFQGQAIVPRTVTTSDYDLGNGRYTLFLANVAVHGQVRFGTRGKKRPERNEPEPPDEPHEPGDDSQTTPEAPEEV